MRSLAELSKEIYVPIFPGEKMGICFREITRDVQRWLGRKQGQQGIIGVSDRPEGISIARVLRRKKGSPLLIFSDFQENTGISSLRALQETVRREGFTGSRSVGIVEPGAYSLLQIELPDVPAAEMQEAVRWLTKDLLDFPHEEAIIDAFQVPNSHRERSRLGYAVAARQSLVKKHVDLLRGAKLRISAIDIPEKALHYLASELAESEQGVAFIYPNRRQTLITISRNGILYLSRALAIGTDDFPAQPTTGDTGPEELPSQVRDLLNTIILETQRSLDFYESQFAQSPVAAIVLAPPESPFPVLLAYFQEHLGNRVRPFDLADIFESAPLQPEQQAQCLLAAGAALRPEQNRS